MKIIVPSRPPIMSVFVLVMTRWSECADFGNFNPFLAGFWPVMALVSVSKALNENISPHYDWIEFEQQKKLNNNDFLDEVADFGPFSPTLACFWPVMAPVSMSKALNEYS